MNEFANGVPTEMANEFNNYFCNMASLPISQYSLKK